MTARPIRYQRQVLDRNGKIFYTSITSLSHISKIRWTVWRTTLNIFVELVDGAFVSNMTQIEDCNDGIFLLSHWKLQNYICEQRTTQRKVRVVFMR